MDEPPVTRRTFELLTLALMPLVYAGGILAAVVRYLLPPPPGRRLARLEVGPAEKFLAGEVAQVSFNGRRIYVLHDGKELRALDSTCTHLSCRVNWVPAQKGFVCHCHGGRFEASGARISGPPERPLAVQPFEVTPDGRIVLLDAEAKT